MAEEDFKVPQEKQDEHNTLQSEADVPSVLGDPRFDAHARKIFNEVIIKPITVSVQGISAATAGYYGYFFTADRAYKVISITERHRTLGTNGSPVTLQVEKLASGTAQGAGKNLLATAFSLKATVDTPQYGTLTTTTADLVMKRGDSLGLVTSGTLTAVADVNVTVLVKEI